MTDVKQVVVMRKDLGMRKGKMVAQGAHASIAFLTNKMRDKFDPEGPVEFDDGHRFHVVGRFRLSEAEYLWTEGLFTKVCVGVDSEQQLVNIHQAALDAGLVSHLITDAGLTEFGGVPTVTCCAIGPDESDKIDKITGTLKLL